MTDYEQRKPKQQTRGRSPQAKTVRSKAKQADHTRDYDRVRSQRARDITAAAKARAREFVALISQPIAGCGPFGQFTLPQLLVIEFAGQLGDHLSPETLRLPHKSSTGGWAGRGSVV